MGMTTMLAKAAFGKAKSMVGNKATLFVTGKNPAQIPVQFNPSQYTITSGSQYSQRERRKENEPSINYNGSVLSTLNVQLIFNTAEFSSLGGLASSISNLISGTKPPDIVDTISKITQLTRIDGENHQPPGCVFVWGSLQFAGFVESVGVTYTMFDTSGKPLSATVNLTMRGFNGGADERSSPFMSPDRTKARVMTEDANIWGMAQSEYGDVREWRRIAEANDVINPLDIPVGKMLRVPSIND